MAKVWQCFVIRWSGHSFIVVLSLLKGFSAEHIFAVKRNFSVVSWLEIHNLFCLFLDFEFLACLHFKKCTCKFTLPSDICPL